MDARPGEIVTIGHYSALNVFKSMIKQIKGKSFVLKIPREFSAVYYSVGDPIVLAFSREDSFEITGARITGFDAAEEMLEAEPDNDAEWVDKRLYERIPVSHYADIRVKDSGRKCYSLVKDMSYYGLLIFLDEDLYIGQLMHVDIFLDREILSFNAQVARKHQGPVHMEYGLRILHRGPFVYNRIQSYFKKHQGELVNRFNIK